MTSTRRLLSRLATCCALAGTFLAANAAGTSTDLPSMRDRAVAPRLAAPVVDDGLPAETTADARTMIRWAQTSGDAHGQPFAVVDKQGARMFVFDGSGRLIGQTAVLTGLQRGDFSVPGIGLRPVAQIKPAERTTPAGRFGSFPGRNSYGEMVVWVDYQTGIAIHRLRPGASEAARARSLATATPDDNRMSFGCVVVPPAFFDGVVAPVLGRGHGVVYVMPDDQRVEAMFNIPGAKTTTVAQR